MLEHLHWSAPTPLEGARAVPPADIDLVVDARRCTVQLANGFLYLDAIADRATALLAHDAPPDVPTKPTEVRAMIEALAPSYHCAALAQSFDAAVAVATRFVAALGQERDVVVADAACGETKPGGNLAIVSERDTAGRTGEWILSRAWARRPDILLVGETLSAGKPFGAVLTTGDIARRIELFGLHDECLLAQKTSLDCVAGVIQTVTQHDLIAGGSRLMAYLVERLRAVQATCDGIRSLIQSPVDVEIELAPPFTAAQIKRRMCERGVLVGLNHNRIVISPALPMRPAEVDVITGALRGAFANTPTWRPPVCCAACADLVCD